MKFKALILLLALSLSGCSAFGKASPTALPTVVLDQGSQAPQATRLPGGSGVTASGVVAPAQEADLAFSLGGKVEMLDVGVGDQVKGGQELARLEGQENLEAAVSVAQFELLQAQQALEDLKTEAETARVQAMQDIVTYERALRDAQYILDNFTIPTNQANLDAVTALNQMKQRLDEARLAFEPYKNKASGDPIRKARKEDLDQAQADYNAAVRRLQLEYNLDVAGAKLATAQHDYEILKSGPDPDKLRLAEARRDNAQNQLAAAQTALEHLTLTAPFTGTISKVNFNSGEWVTAGQSILALADLDNLVVETTDLSERDVPQVEIGQPVTIYIKALGQTITGRVSKISPLADTLGGDVVYKITIEPDTLPPGLRAGMSVEVQFGTG